MRNPGQSMQASSQEMALGGPQVQKKTPKVNIQQQGPPPNPVPPAQSGPFQPLPQMPNQMMAGPPPQGDGMPGDLGGQPDLRQLLMMLTKGGGMPPQGGGY